jgi:DNA-directed RNA polymerase specialized sigma24 family protein
VSVAAALSHETHAPPRQPVVGLRGRAEHDRVCRLCSAFPRQRAVTVLRYYEDLSEAEIAATLGMAPGTVKSHSHAAARRLALVLAEPTPDSAGREMTVVTP